MMWGNGAHFKKSEKLFYLLFTYPYREQSVCDKNDSSREMEKRSTLRFCCLYLLTGAVFQLLHLTQKQSLDLIEVLMYIN